MKKAIRIVGVLLGLSVVGYGIFRYAHATKYPYGFTHRCSKSFSPYLTRYAEAHDGNYPQPETPGQFGLSQIIGEYHISEGLLELVVGKAGDLDSARAFHEKHGYLRPEHSSWHYVSGLSNDDEGRALAWDKIPLNHNGGRETSNPREVIMVGGRVDVILEKDWAQFLQHQKHLASQSSGAYRVGGRF